MGLDRKLFPDDRRANAEGTYSPWTNHAARRYCSSLDDFVDEKHCAQETWVSQKVYQPDIRIVDLGAKVVAKLSSELEYRLFDRDDLVWWRGSTNRKNVTDNFQGRIGERLLSLVLRGFIQERVSEAQEHGYTKSSGGILKERRKREGKPFHKHIVHWNGTYLLKFDRRTTFVMLKKSAQGRTLHYIENVHIQKCEIDGLGSLYVRAPDGEPEQKYLIIAEVNTTLRERILPNAWDLKSPRPSGESIESRLFEPLASLFSGYTQAYVLMGHNRALFTKVSSSPYLVLTKNCSIIAERLAARGIVPIFMPIPGMVDCPALAQKCYEALVRYRREMKL